MSSQPRIALLTAHGQPSSPQRQEDALAELADQVAVHLPGWDVRSATLSMPDRLEQVAEDGVLVYPFFMAQGWFASTVLTKRLKGISHKILQPFGLDPALPQMVAKVLSRDLTQDPVHSRPLLLAAHGSARGQKAAEAAEFFARNLQHYLPNVPIQIGYIEQAPFLQKAAQGLPGDSICLPFFAQEGDHVRVDIPLALKEASFSGSVLPSVGAFLETPLLIANALQMANQP